MSGIDLVNMAFKYSNNDDIFIFYMAWEWIVNISFIY